MTAEDFQKGIRIVEGLENALFGLRTITQLDLTKDERKSLEKRYTEAAVKFAKGR